MKPPKTSLAVLMGLVVVAALDFAWFRWFVSNKRSLFGFEPMGMDFGLVPMASILIVLGAHVVSRRGRIGSFAFGFASCGMAILIVYCAFCEFAPTFMRTVTEMIYERTAALTSIEDLEPTLRRYLPPIPFEYSQIGCVTVLLSVPQLLVASAGGVIFKYVGRRRRAAMGA